MKLETFRKLNAHSVMITVFFTGIVVSGGNLYLVNDTHPGSASLALFVSVGLTFLAGVLAISLMAGRENRTVVYLEKKREEHRVQTKSAVTESVSLSVTVLEPYLDDPQRWLNTLCGMIGAAQGALFLEHDNELELTCGYAMVLQDLPKRFGYGEGLIGRVAREKTTLRIDDLPAGYITVFSGLGQTSPRHLLIVPVKAGNDLNGVLELATFSAIDPLTCRQIEHVCEVLAPNLIHSFA